MSPLRLVWSPRVVVSRARHVGRGGAKKCGERPAWEFGAAYDQRAIELERAHLILYVADQSRSARFYAAALDLSPSLDVPGMTEFTLGTGCVLGLMPLSAIRRVLPELPDPASAEGIPRAEIYLVVDDPAACHRRSLAAGGAELSALAERDWGHEAAYSLDPDGHVLAFARALVPKR